MLNRRTRWPVVLLGALGWAVAPTPNAAALAAAATAPAAPPATAPVAPGNAAHATLQFFEDAKAKRVDLLRERLIAPRGGDHPQRGDDQHLLDAVEAGLFAEADFTIADAREQGDHAVTVMLYRRQKGGRPDVKNTFLIREQGVWKVLPVSGGFDRLEKLTPEQKRSLTGLEEWANERRTSLQRSGALNPTEQETARMRLNSDLVQAAVRGNQQEARALIAKGADVKGPAMSDSTTPLRAAVKGSRAELIRLLVEHGAKLDKPGRPLLVEAIRHSKPEIAPLLIELGADVNRGWPDGPVWELPLGEAVANGRGDLVELMIEKGAETDIDAKLGMPLLHLAALSGDGATFDLIKPLYKDLRVEGRGGVHALHAVAGAPWSSGKDTGRIARELLKAGVNPHAVTKNSALSEPGIDTPLRMAANQGKSDVIAALLESVKYQQEELDAALILAARYSDAANVRRLLDAGASARAERRAKDGKVYTTPLHDAVRRWEPKKVLLLLDRGALLEARVAPHGRTPLHHAVASSHPDVVKLLLDRGADPKAKDDAGNDAAALARVRLRLGREGWGRSDGYMPEAPSQPDAGRAIAKLLGVEVAPASRPAD